MQTHIFIGRSTRPPSVRCGGNRTRRFAENASRVSGTMPVSHLSVPTGPRPCVLRSSGLPSLDAGMEQAHWTENDFDRMSWHDNTIHGLAFPTRGGAVELTLDIDYILQWIRGSWGRAQFLIAPAQL